MGYRKMVNSIQFFGMRYEGFLSWRPIFCENRFINLTFKATFAKFDKHSWWQIAETPDWKSKDEKNSKSLPVYIFYL